MNHKHSFGWRPDTPDQRDKKMEISYFRRFSVMLPSSVDLRDGMPAVYDQGDLGSCTGNAIAGAIAYGHFRQKLPEFDPSRLFIYYNERKIEGTIQSDAGAEIRDGIKSVAKDGVCLEQLWPYEVSKYKVKPPPSAYKAAHSDIIKSYYRVPQTVDYLKAVLALGIPIVFGFTCYENMDSQSVDKSGRIPMPKGVSIGGHAVLLVGYPADNSEFIFRNSWGEEWGDKGYGTLPFAYVSNPDLADDFWAIKTVS